MSGRDDARGAVCPASRRGVLGLSDESPALQSPGELELVERPKPTVAAGRGRDSVAPRRRLRNRLCIFSTARSPISNIRASSATNWPAKSTRSARQPLAAGPAGRDHSLSFLRVMRRLPARQDQLLPATAACSASISTAAWPIISACPKPISSPPRASALDEAAMVEFLAIGAHAVAPRRGAPGDRVLVVGAGPIGVACMIFARLRGAEVTALDTRADRLEFCANEIGVDSLRRRRRRCESRRCRA